MAVTKDAIDGALQRGHTIDITTKGRKSGKPRTIEIVFHNIAGRIYISGTPTSPGASTSAARRIRESASGC